MTFLIYLKNILQLILAPANGWKDISKKEIPFETVLARGLYPLMAIMLLTVFIQPAYGLIKFDLIKLLQVALIQFIAIFVALQIARNVMIHFIASYNNTGQKDPVAVDNVTAYGVGIVVLLQIIQNALPIDTAVIKMLPILAVIPIWKADKYLDISRSGEMSFMMITVCAIILPVIVINLIMMLF